ncbi:MAG: type II toxin-antitoxin system Phd/YefM family antitoxin [Lachnospiraceae bacterium]|nr:type II toxin-antitoxin system Phd/YefM family antitoxin [Lachnospiraceae bacterium]
MKDLVREMDFTTLKNNFDEICDEINNGSDAVALTLKSGRKVFIMPEKNYDNISHIVMIHTSENAMY